MNRRGFLTKAALVGGIAALQPWQLLKMLGTTSGEQARQTLLSWDIPASAATIPQNYTIAAGTQLDAFDSIANWAVSSGTGTRTDNTDLTYVRTGTTSMRMSVTAGTNFQVIRTVSWDLSQRNRLSLWCYVPSLNLSGLANGLSSIIVYMANDTGFTNVYNFLGLTSSVLVKADAWVQLTLTKADFAVSAGSPTWTGITKPRIRIDATGTDGLIYFGELLFGTDTRPIITLGFDDNFDTQYTIAYPAMVARNLPGYISFVSSTPGTGGYMTYPQLDEVYAAGWPLLNHTSTHQNLSSLSSAQVTDELSACAAVMQAHGYTRHLTHAVFPQGGVSATTDSVVQSLKFVTGRGGRASFAYHQQAVHGGIDNPRRIISIDIGNSGVSLAQAKVVVDNCVRLGTSAHLFFHKFAGSADSVTWVTADFTALLDYILRLRDSNVLDVMSYPDWYNGLTIGRRRRVS